MAKEWFREYTTPQETLRNWVRLLNLVVGRFDCVVDYNAPLSNSKPTAGGKPDYDYTNCGYLFPRNDATEILIAQVQLPHGWAEGTDIFPHVHWRQSRNEQAIFKIDYKWYNNGEIEPALWSTYIMDTYAFTYVSGTLSQINYNATGISGVGKSMSSILLVKLYRDDDVYAADALADNFDIHLKLDSIGSAKYYSK